MTPEPALWNCRSRGFESGGASKKRRKNGSSRSGLWPGCSLMVPRVAMFTTEGDTRLTIGASVGMGAAASAAGTAARAGPLIANAVSAAAANCRRRFMRGPSGDPLGGEQNKAGLDGPACPPVSRRYYTEGRVPRIPLGGFDQDLVRLHLRQLRDCDFQHTIGDLRLDVLCVSTLREAESALEFAAYALDAAEALARLLA